MREYVVAQWGTWDAAAQRASHEKSFDTSKFRIVLVDGDAAGVLEVLDFADHVQLGTLYLLPAYQSRGVGAFLLQRVLADAVGRPVRLRTLAVNARAQRFYARHGFRTTSVTPERVYMEAMTV